MAENKISVSSSSRKWKNANVKRSPDKAKFKIQHDFDAISANKELPSHRNTLRQISWMLLEFWVSCRVCYPLVIYQQPLGEKKGERKRRIDLRRKYLELEEVREFWKKVEWKRERNLCGDRKIGKWENGSNLRAGETRDKKRKIGRDRWISAEDVGRVEKWKLWRR